MNGGVGLDGHSRPDASGTQTAIGAHAQPEPVHEHT